MQVLLIKTSSLGDVLHALPALTDAMQSLPDVRFDWVVEEAFQEIPAWHPAVDQVIPVALRRWRKNPWQALSSGEWQRFRTQLRRRRYDLVLDSQGLIKSAWIARQAYGPRAGFDRASAREPLTSLAYQQGYPVAPNQHAITRQRSLFAQALGYRQPETQPDSGLTMGWEPDRQHPYIVLLHGTTWPSKEWPEENWIELSKLARADGFAVKIVWGNDVEKARAQRIAAAADAIVLPRLQLLDAAQVIANASSVIGVDSGLAHLTAAIGVTAVTLYGATDAKLTGAMGIHQTNLQGHASCAPCLTRNCLLLSESSQQACWLTLSAREVWQRLIKLQEMGA